MALSGPKLRHPLEITYLTEDPELRALVADYYAVDENGCWREPLADVAARHGYRNARAVGSVIGTLASVHSPELPCPCGREEDLGVTRSNIADAVQRNRRGGTCWRCNAERARAEHQQRLDEQVCVAEVAEPSPREGRAQREWHRLLGLLVHSSAIDRWEQLAHAATLYDALGVRNPFPPVIAAPVAAETVALSTTRLGRPAATIGHVGGAQRTTDAPSVIRCAILSAFMGLELDAATCPSQFLGITRKDHLDRDPISDRRMRENYDSIALNGGDEDLVEDLYSPEEERLSTLLSARHFVEDLVLCEAIERDADGVLSCGPFSDFFIGDLPHCIEGEHLPPAPAPRYGESEDELLSLTLLWLLGINAPDRTVRLHDVPDTSLDVLFDVTYRDGNPTSDDLMLSTFDRRGSYERGQEDSRERRDFADALLNLALRGRITVLGWTADFSAPVDVRVTAAGSERLLDRFKPRCRPSEQVDAILGDHLCRQIEAELLRIAPVHA